MVEVYTLGISKADFQRLPKEERAVVLVGGHILNHIGVLLKLVQFSFSRDPLGIVEERASGMQTQILLQFLMAVLSEACVYFDDRNRIKLIDGYLSDMHEEGKAAYDTIKEVAADKKGFLRLLRNNYLYHYPNDKNVEKAFISTPDDEPWEWYLSSTNTSSLYFSSELVIGYALMKATGESTEARAFSVVMAKATEIANTMPDFLMRLMEAIIMRHLGADALKPRQRTTIGDAPRFGEFWLPFFVEVPPEETDPAEAANDKLSVARSALMRSRARISG
jgi:hypothetical protein